MNPALTLKEQTILQLIGPDEIAGRVLRGKLADTGYHTTGPGFYLTMSRLEQWGYVDGWYNHKTVPGGLVVKERTYRRTGAGHYALAESLQNRTDSIGGVPDAVGA